MRGLTLAAGAAFLGLAGCGGADPETAEGSGAPDYADAANWLCHGDELGYCDRDNAISTIAADGTMSVEPLAMPETDPGIDCFYLYPTASQDDAGNSDLDLMTGPGEEDYAVARNFSQFAGVCRLFAPIYRSVTLKALDGETPAGDQDLAYGDTLAAWKYYLEHDNGGRGVVLVGHSQGSFHIKRLLMEEIEGTPVQDLLVGALPIGANIAVPEGADVGGDLKSIPLCRALGQTGCLVTYNSYRASAPPPEDALLGGVAPEGMHWACVNPADLAGTEGDTPLDAWLTVDEKVTSVTLDPPIEWVEGKQVETPLVRLPGLLSGQCVSDEHGDYLSVTVHGDPADPRTDDIQGDIRADGVPIPSWGLHYIDPELAKGDLVGIVRAQGEAWARR